jgi:hypothetical protein
VPSMKGDSCDRRNAGEGEMGVVRGGDGTRGHGGMVHTCAWSGDGAPFCGLYFGYV